MGSVVINGNTYQIYGDQAGATVYHDASLGDAAGAWAVAAPATTQRKALVAATRLLDRQRWKGIPVGAPAIDVVLEWPRTGVTDRYGNAVSSLTVPDDVIVACYELAAMILNDASVQDNATSGSNVASVQAGPAAVSFFRPTLGQTGRFDTKIQELVGQYLGGSSTSEGSAEAFGTDFASSFDSEDSYGINRQP